MAFILNIKMLPGSCFICKHACENQFYKTDLTYTEKKPTTFRLYGHEKLILLYVNDYNMKSNSEKHLYYKKPALALCSLVFGPSDLKACWKLWKLKK